MLISDPKIAETQARPNVVAAPAALDSVLGFIRRHFALAAITTILACAAWLMHVYWTAPRFLATAKVLVDSNAPALLALSNKQQLALPDTQEIPTEVDLLKSEYIARKVIQDFDLTYDADLSGDRLRDRILSTLAGLLVSIRESDLPAPIFTTILLVRSYLNQPTDQSARRMQRTIDAFQRRSS